MSVTRLLAFMQWTLFMSFLLLLVFTYAEYEDFVVEMQCLSKNLDEYNDEYNEETKQCPDVCNSPRQSPTETNPRGCVVTVNGVKLPTTSPKKASASE